MFIGYIGKLLWRVINDYRRTALKFNEGHVFLHELGWYRDKVVPR